MLEADLITETAESIAECLEWDGEDVTGIDVAGIKSILTVFAHRLKRNNDVEYRATRELLS